MFQTANRALGFGLCVPVLCPLLVHAHGSGGIFPFYLDGAHAEHPTPSGGWAYGTLTYRPGSCSLSITYGVSSPVHEISAMFFNQNGSSMDFGFNSGPGYLPSSGVYTFSRSGPFIDLSVLEAIHAGRATLSLYTDEYPWGHNGEIGGTIIPEPSVLSLCLVTGGVLGTFYLRRRLA